MKFLVVAAAIFGLILILTGALFAVGVVMALHQNLQTRRRLTSDAHLEQEYQAWLKREGLS